MIESGHGAHPRNSSPLAESIPRKFTHLTSSIQPTFLVRKRGLRKILRLGSQLGPEQILLAACGCFRPAVYLHLLACQSIANDKGHYRGSFLRATRRQVAVSPIRLAGLRQGAGNRPLGPLNERLGLFSLFERFETTPAPQDRSIPSSNGIFSVVLV